MTPNTEQAALSVSVAVARVRLGLVFLPLSPGDVIILICPGTGWSAPLSHRCHVTPSVTMSTSIFLDD